MVMVMVIWLCLWWYGYGYDYGYGYVYGGMVIWLWRYGYGYRDMVMVMVIWLWHGMALDQIRSGNLQGTPTTITCAGSDTATADPSDDSAAAAESKKMSSLGTSLHIPVHLRSVTL